MVRELARSKGARPWPKEIKAIGDLKQEIRGQEQVREWRDPHWYSIHTEASLTPYFKIYGVSMIAQVADTLSPSSHTYRVLPMLSLRAPPPPCAPLPPKRGSCGSSRQRSCMLGPGRPGRPPARAACPGVAQPAARPDAAPVGSGHLHQQGGRRRQRDSVPMHRHPEGGCVGSAY